MVRREMIRCFVKRPGQMGNIRFVCNTLPDLQQIVGGPIECIALDAKTILICNECGKHMNLPVNFPIEDDLIVGTAIITGLSSDDFSSLRWTEDRCRQFVGETA